MPLSPIFARRSLHDIDHIAKLTMRSAVRVSGKIRARYIESLKSGFAFKVRPYILQQLQPIFVAGMLAAHLSGYRRLFLIKKQTPSLMKRVLEAAAKESISLSALDDALEVLQRRASLDVDRLQAQYNTQALKVLNDVSKDIETELDKTVKDLIEQGAHVSEAKQALAAKFDELGLSPRAPYQLEAIFRTQLQMGFAAGRYQAEQSPEIDEILWGYKYVTTGDDRVREEHAILEGTTLPKNDPFWQRFYPPNGWNCRCQVIPLFEEREIKPAPEFDEEGAKVAPDKGFDFNPGIVFAAPAPALPVAPPVIALPAKTIPPMEQMYNAQKQARDASRPDIELLSSQLKKVSSELSDAFAENRKLQAGTDEDAIASHHIKLRELLNSQDKARAALTEAYEKNGAITRALLDSIHPSDTRGLFQEGTTSQEFKNEVEKAYKSVPSGLRDLVKSAGINVVTTDFSSDASFRLLTSNPRGHAEGTNWKALEGVYLGPEKRCVVSENILVGDGMSTIDGVQVRYEHYDKSERTRGVFFHEFGHAIDASNSSKSADAKWFSDAKEFRQSYSKDIARLHSSDDKDAKDAAAKLEYYIQGSGANSDEVKKLEETLVGYRQLVISSDERFNNYVKTFEGEGKVEDSPRYARLKESAANFKEAVDSLERTLEEKADGSTSAGRSEAFAEGAAILLDGVGCNPYNAEAFKKWLPETLRHISSVLEENK